MRILMPMRRLCLYVIVCLIVLNCPAARAAVGSTIDEWAERFLPEAGPTIDLPSYADGYDRAIAQIAAGEYRVALCTIADIKTPDPARVAILRAQSLAGLGETDDALSLLNIPSLANDPIALTLKAKLLIDDNQLATAQQPIDTLLAAKPDSITGHLLRGQLLEARGDFPQAIIAYHWFIEGPQAYLEKWQTDASQFESADDIVSIATAIDRWATLTMAFKDDQSLNNTILAMFTQAYDVVDRDSVSARVAAAEFALSHSDTENAAKILEPLEKLAPLNRDVLRAEMQLAIASGDDRAFHTVINALDEVEPDSVDAGILNVISLARARSAGACGEADALRTRHPDRLNLLGLYAAVSFMSGHEKQMDTALADADKLSPKRSDAYVQAGEILEMAFQRDEAEALLKIAIARTPWETTPRHLLGDLYLNDGYDDQARAALNEAYALDPYNVKTVNYLRLLDDLAKYDKRISAHFIVYSDRDADPIAADQIGQYMEATYADICQIFQYWPKTKIIVQIYPQDDQFSVRMAGVPGVENFGVSFGRVLATIAPREGTNQGNFNFARVLRHEFVHTINLLQTNQRCPRWLTEGFAVWQEGVPFRFANVPPELYKRAMNDDLFSIRTFPLAFIRPTRPGDGEQAYTQAMYLARYMDEVYGRQSIIKLLDAYGRSLSDAQAFQFATGQPMEKFEQDWHAWMKQKVKPWGYDDATTKKVAALEKDGEQLLKDKQYPEALKDWQAACDLQPAEVKPHQRLAFLYLRPALFDAAKAIEHLKFLHMLELQDNRYAKEISRLYTKLNDTPDAIAWAKQATYVNLYDPAAHQMLADAYTTAGDTSQADAEKQVVLQIQLWQQKRDAAKPADAAQP